MKKKTVLKGLLCATLCCVAVGGAITLARLSGGESVAALEEAYSKNQTVEIPQKKITVGDTEYDSTAMIVYPDGSSYTVRNGKIEVLDAGLYTVVYYTVVDGKYYEERETFTVKESAVSFDGKKSSWEYGAHEKYATDKNGIVARIAPNETLSYNGIVDLNEFDGEAVFSMFCTPATLGTEDASRITVTFTDIYDSNNFVRVALKRYIHSGDWAHLNTYIQAGANGQEMVGLEPSTEANTIVVNGSRYRKYQDGYYGVYIPYSISGYLNSNEEIGDKEFKLFWDYENKAIYTGNGSMKKLVTYLDHPLCHEKAWEGFTTGEVFVSVNATSYQNATLDLVVTKIGNHDLSVGEVEVDRAPSISVDYAGHEKGDLPKAVKGVPYTLFNASAWDIYEGNISVSAEVYFGYYGTNAYRVPVKDGKFTPDEEGTYTIVYTAKNAFGLKAEYPVNVQTVNATDTIEIELVNPLQNAVSGNEVRVVDSYAVKHAFGNSSVDIVATLKSNPEISYKIDKDALTFTPLYAGVYEVAFTARDYVLQTQEKFEISVTAKQEPYIASEIVLPKLFIEGNTYRLPTAVYGYDLSSGAPKQVTCTLEVKEDGNGVSVTKDGVYTVGEAQTVTVSYSVSAGSNKTSKSFEIPVRSVKNADGELDITKYFVYDSDSASVAADDDYAYLRFNEDTVFEFINPLRADSFSVMFFPSTPNFTAVDIYLSSVQNASQKVKITVKNDGNLQVFVNGKYKTQYAGSFADFADSSMQLEYEGDTVTLNDNSFTLDSYINGEKFEGFEGELAFSMGMSSVSGASQMTFVKLNNQYFYNFTGDLIEPQLSLERMVGERDTGEKITLKPASAYDVLSGYVPHTYSVTLPDGTYGKADDGTVLDGKQDTQKTYVFTLTDFGRYSVVYRAQDGSGNALRYTYTVYCADSVLPSVTIERTSMTAKVGVIVIPRIVSMSDNLTPTEALQVQTTLLLPSGKMIALLGNAFEATVAGEYVVYYNVFDEMGHFTQAKCVITVTE